MLEHPDDTPPQTLYQLLLSRASIYADQPAIHALGRQPLTYRALDAQIGYVRDVIRRAGLTYRDRIGIVLPNGPEMAIVFLGVASSATAAPLNPHYRHEEFQFYMSDARVRALIVLAGSDSPAIDVARDMNVPILYLTPQPDDPAGLFEVDGPRPDRAGAASLPGPNDVALVLHTSGTTSRPKLVPLTQQNLTVSAQNIQRSLALSPQDICLNVMPLFHIHGLAGALLSSLSAGAGVVCTPGFYAPEFFGWLDACRPTWYTAVPTMHQSILLRAGDHREIIERSFLRFIRSSSSALPPSVMQDLETIFGVPVVEAYGMTEASHQMAINPLPPDQRKRGSVGPASGPEIAIMSKDGQLLPANREGEIVIRGPSVTSGYENNREANVAAFTKGWFRTGDAGKLDDDGYLFITGRIKEIINRGGEKVSPREVDEVLLAHPDVVQAVTFAIPDPRLGEAVGAAVILAEGIELSQRQLQDYAAGRLAHFKVPEQIVFVDEIPRGPTGKLQRIGLAERLGVTKTAQDSPDTVDYVAPQTVVEEMLAHIWAEVLGLDQVSTQAAFLDLGGDSMLATQIVARIRDRIQVDVTLLDFFDAPTIVSMASIVEEALLSGPESAL